MEYIIDSNIFIQAYKAHYPLDVALSFWRKLQELINSGHVISIDKVGAEIKALDDDLKTWCETNCGDRFFCSTQGEDVIEKYKSVVGWASSSQQFSAAEKKKFMDSTKADAFLVAYASVDPQNRVVVTEEVSAPNGAKIKIPDVCNQYGVRCLNTMQLFRELRQTF